MRTVLPRFYVHVLTYEEKWSEDTPLFGVRDRATKTCSGQDMGIFAGFGIKQAMVIAAHHNRHAAMTASEVQWSPEATRADKLGYAKIQAEGFYP